MDNNTPQPRPPANASDHLANERTFLAWIRTSIALMGFGFVVVKFSLFVKQISLALGEKAALASKGFSSVIGVVLVAIGAILAVLAYLQYRRTDQQLLQKTYRPGNLLSFSLTLGMVLISGLLIWYLLPGLH
jgi:putative membrane protein